ncbi:threonine/serine dehydratase [Arenibaculum pallidiluteum]|uniref:threonine/serine dehydratase n=1 Tax=Arenibaculum pallidiluteum TaxID=2812559 RepID=UPI001A97D1CD|nr:threonine/serine dehydratase [Arenibaculum pallidiluteum]
MTIAPDLLPCFEDIAAAAEALAGKAILTPLLESPLLNDRLGFRLLLKPEMLQRTGSFKFRGAYNRICRIPEADRRRGVVAFSSGNHAQGVAAAARAFGIPATIVMPGDAPAIKIRNTRSWGAEVVLYDRHTENRDLVADRIVAQTGATLVRPYDDRFVMAGQGTIGIELLDQTAAIGATLDAVVVPCGGGGMTAGIATALAQRAPNVALWAAEPEAFDDTRRSLAAGERLGNAPGARSICDSLLSPMPGELTFAINRQRLAGAVPVSDAEALEAMAACFEYFKLIAEPGGAVALAAVLTGRVRPEGAVAVVCSGGNVDPAMFGRALGTT